MGNKLRVGILCGGKSAEHEVSLQSAKNVVDAIDRSKYEPVLIGIDKDGHWLLHNTDDFLRNSGDPKRISLNDRGTSAALIPESKGSLSSFTPGEAASPAIDVAFPILHGPFGEDGTVQGLLKLAGIPFVGSGVLGSAAGMDKDVMKRLLRDSSLPIGKFCCIRLGGRIPDYAELCAQLGSPFFVKPANMGSSVGVSKVSNHSEYDKAVNEAFLYDTKVMIEQFIKGREIECSVLGSALGNPFDGNEPIASLPGEVKPLNDFYSYNAKYIDADGAALLIPADLDGETVERVQKLAIEVFNALCCDGLARVDFFLTEDSRIIVNEINTMPGFTRISMYPKLWEVSGLSYAALINRLIELAIFRFEKERVLTTSVTL